MLLLNYGAELEEHFFIYLNLGSWCNFTLASVRLLPLTKSYNPTALFQTPAKRSSKSKTWKPPKRIQRVSE
jgi:hypothetical protein